MMYKSGINLFSSITDYFSTEDDIVIISAYVKTEIIKNLNSRRNLRQIIVRWEIEDLVKGISDLDLYHYCIENNIQLFRNTRIHIKACWNYESRIVFGSANYTGKGLGLTENFNYELCALNDDMSFEDKVYLNTILNTSELVTAHYFQELSKVVNSVQYEKEIFPKFTFSKQITDSFSLSQLPMSLSPDDLYDVIINSNDYGDLEQNCAAHDISLYSIGAPDDYVSFKIELKNKFNSHPFIEAFKEHIKKQNSKSLNYGRVVDWIQNKSTSVPIPRRWEIKKNQIVNILYTWICALDENFTWDIPGARSEVITYNFVDSTLIDFINNLKRDKARGNIAPHQIILLISLMEIYHVKETYEITFEELFIIYNKTWKLFEKNFHSNNPELGMPLKAFLSRNYINLKLNNPIENYRNENDLKKKIDKILISEKLINIFSLTNAKKYIISRIIQ